MSAVCVRLRGLRHDRWQVAPVKIPLRRVPHFPRRQPSAHTRALLRPPLTQNIFIPIAYLSRLSVLNDGRLHSPTPLLPVSSFHVHIIIVSSLLRVNIVSRVLCQKKKSFYLINIYIYVRMCNVYA